MSKVLMDWTPGGDRQWKIVIDHLWWSVASKKAYGLLHTDYNGAECDSVYVYHNPTVGTNSCPTCGASAPEEIRFMANMLLVADETLDA